MLSRVLSSAGIRPANSPEAWRAGDGFFKPKWEVVDGRLLIGGEHRQVSVTWTKKALERELQAALDRHAGSDPANMMKVTIHGAVATCLFETGLLSLTALRAATTPNGYDGFQVGGRSFNLKVDHKEQYRQVQFWHRRYHPSTGI